MLTVVSLCFLFGWLLPPDSMAVSFNIPLRLTDNDIPLDVAKDSVDDMYFGCNKEMMGQVQSGYLEKEMHLKAFARAWLNAEKCSEKKPDEEDKALTKDHMQAICVYTGNDLYRRFNKAVRTQRPIYNTTFKFHSLHFLLTSAIQILNKDNQCHITYRRTNSRFSGRVNQIVRFGTFTSSSYSNELFLFGHKTCFKIHTCSGAYLKNYSAMGEAEEEVLIPPYETFRVTKIVPGPHAHGKLRDCEVVYKLESEGVESRLNCKAAKPRANSAASSSRLQETKEDGNAPPSSGFLDLIRAE